MAVRIALFNHKGGVSKTTTTFNLGWKLAELGKKVILVDGDPQCNLTGIVLGYKGPTELERFFTEEKERNIKSALSPAFESRPKEIEAVSCVPVPQREGLFLLPGHIGLAEYEVTLGIAQELTGSLQALQNLPGSFAYLFEKTAAAHNADYVLIDMSPSLSSINQNLLMTSDAFIVPTAPDFYSLMAIDSLASILPRWHAWATRAQSMAVFRDAAYPLPAVTPKMLGTVVQKFRPRKGQPADAFQRWIDKIDEAVKLKLVPALERCSMLLPQEKYAAASLEASLRMATISEFNSLIAISQENQTPVFALHDDQLSTGAVKEAFVKSRDAFNEIFTDLGKKVITLTT